MGDEFKVPQVHIDTHAKLLKQQTRTENTDSTENNKKLRVPRAHIEAHAKLLQEQQKIQKRIMELDSINDIKRQQKEAEAQLKILLEEEQQKKISNEFKYGFSE